MRDHPMRHNAVVMLVLLVACSSDGPVTPGNENEQAPAGTPALGPNASLNGKRPFPSDNPWNQDVSNEPVDPNSTTLINSCGIRNLHPDFGTTFNGAPHGIPYVVVSGNQPRVNVTFDYADESDPGPYPVPPNAPIEGG